MTTQNSTGRFVQLHLLTSYPPANLNRDDLGRPKTAVMGNAPRLRISSQSLKRAWRTSDVFDEKLSGHLGTRTKRLGSEVFKTLFEGGVPEDKAFEWAGTIAGVFGKWAAPSKEAMEELGKLPDAERLKQMRAQLQIEQLAHISPEEHEAVDVLAKKLIQRRKAPAHDELVLLRQNRTAADIALFGRMLADSPAFNAEAAAQVAHAITVHRVAVEDDYFTAVDDLNRGEEDLGAAHVGETEFAAGLFYLYLCIDRELLKENLGGNADVTARAIEALTEAAATVAPRGKQASFASRARASYVLCERGDQQPRTLSVAFLRPVDGTDMLDTAIIQLRKTMGGMDQVYGPCASHRQEFNVLTGSGTLKQVMDCAVEGLA